MRIVGRLGIAFLAAASMTLHGCISSPLGKLDARDFQITIDYGESIEEMVRAGDYRRVYSEINSTNFPSTAIGSRRLAVRLVRLNPGVSIAKVLAGQAAAGFRAADIRELLAFGRTYPDIQRSAVVVGLGSHRTYATIKYERFGMDPADVDEVRSFQAFYPGLITDLFGRAAVLIQEDWIPVYSPGSFYGCFVEEAPAPAQ